MGGYRDVIMKQLLPLVALLVCSQDQISSPRPSPLVDVDSWTHITGVFVNPHDDYVYATGNNIREISRDGTARDFLPNTLLVEYALINGIPMDEKADIEMKILRKVWGENKTRYCVQFIPMNNEAVSFLENV